MTNWEIKPRVTDLILPGFRFMLPHSTRNTDNNVEILVIVQIDSVNNFSALDLHLISNLALKIPISTRYCIILIHTSASKSPCGWINYTIANQNNPIVQTNKTRKTLHTSKY